MKKNNLLLFVTTFLIITSDFIVTLKIKFNGILSFVNPLFYDGKNLISLLFILIGLYMYNYFNSNMKYNYSVFFRNIFVYIFPIYLLFIIFFSILNDNFNLYYIFPHLFFINNWFPDLISINNNTWIINIVFQFLIISHIIYLAIERKPKITYILCLLISIFSRFCLYHIAIPNSIYNELIYFEIYGKQLITTIDAFALGMLLGKYRDKILIIPKTKVLLLINLLIIYCCSYSSLGKYGVYDSKFAYFYASLFSIPLAFLVTLYYGDFLDMKKIDIEKKAKYIGTLLLFDSTVLFILNKWFNFENNILLFIVYILIVNILAIVLVFCIDHIVLKCKKMATLFRDYYNKYKSSVFSIIAILILIICIPKLKVFLVQDINSFNAIKSNNIIRDDKLEGVVEKIGKIIGDKEYRYLYVSGPEYQGFLNYYMMVYYLAMNKSVDSYNNYISTMYYGSEDDISKYICSVKPDYVIFHNYSLWDEKVINNKDDNLYIYLVDSNCCTTLKDILIPINGGELK